MELLLGFVLVLAVIAVIGHGIWVGVRAVVRMLGSRSSSAERSIAAHLCPRCREFWEPRSGADRCHLCGWPGNVPSIQAGENSVRAMARVRSRVERFAELGLLTTATRDRLIGVLGEEVSSVGVTVHEAKPSPAPTPSAPQPTPLEKPAVEVSTPVSPFQEIAARAIAFREARRPQSETHTIAEPISPRKSRDVRELMLGFLEQSNIRWGEIVGGLLIVGCSLALVISFWSSIAERPLLKFGLFNGTTALVFALGIHAERRWKLPTTATGLLLIASLLTPLNFLAVAALGRGDAVESVWGIAGELGAAALFAGLLYAAGRSLVSGASWALCVGVLVPSLAMLLTRRWVDPGRGALALLALGSIPVLSEILAVGGLMLRSRREPGDPERDSREMLSLLGPAQFAVSLSLGLIVARGGPLSTMLHRLAPLAPLAGVPVLAAGLWLWRKTSEVKLVGYRTAGAGIAAAGTMLMLAGLALAWPGPAVLIPVAILNFAILTGLAILLQIPAAHALAGFCLALAYLVGWSVASGGMPWEGTTSAGAERALLSGQSGAAMVPLVLLFAVASGATALKGRRADARAFALVASVAGVFSLALVTWHGFGRLGDPLGATWVYATYGIVAVVCAEWFARHPIYASKTREEEAWVLPWAGSGLVLVALVQGLMFRPVFAYRQLPWVVALLAHASIDLLALALLARPPSGLLKKGPIFRKVADLSALGSSGLAALGLAVFASFVAPTVSSMNLLGLALVWLALAWRWGSPRIFAGSQAALAGSAVFAVARVLQGTDWYSASRAPWLDPRTLQAQAIAMAGLALGWIALRLGVRRWGAWADESESFAAVAHSLLNPRWPSFDRLLRGAAVLVLVGLSIYGALPGVAQELTPRDQAAGFAAGIDRGGGRIVPPTSAFEILQLPHTQALGGGSWALLALALTVLMAGQWEKFRRHELVAAMLVASMAAPLWAGRWEPVVATASALRWASAGVLLLLSALVWARRPLSAWAFRVGWRIDEGAGHLTGMATGSAIALALLPMAAMGAYLTTVALLGTPPRAEESRLWVGSAILFVTLGAAGCVLPRLNLTRWRGARTDRPTWARQFGALLVALGTLPLVAVTAIVVGGALEGNPIVGPEPGSFFTRIGLAGSYVPPIVILAGTLVGFALRERSSGFALAACLVMNLAATVGYLLVGVSGGEPVSASLAARLALLNAIVGSLSSLAWMGMGEVWRRRKGEQAGLADDGRLVFLISLNLVLVGIVLIGGATALFVNPVPTTLHRSIAGPWGWAGLGLSSVSAIAWARTQRRSPSPELLGVGLLGVVTFAAFGLVFRDAGDWLTYHGLIVAEASAGAAMLLVGIPRARTGIGPLLGDIRVSSARWATVALWAVVAFSLRGYGSDPQSPWWTIGGLTVSAIMASVLAIVSGRPSFLPLAGGLLNLAATLWWCDGPRWGQAAGVRGAFTDLLHVNGIALALPAPIWLWIENRAIQAWSPPAIGSRWREFEGKRPFGRIAAWMALAACSLLVGLNLADDGLRSAATGSTLLGWVALGAALVAMTAGLWDPRARGTMAGLYLLGLCACGQAVHDLHLEPRWLVWSGTMVLSAYSVGATYLWSRRDMLRGVAERFGIPKPETKDSLAALAWMVPVSLALAVLVLVLAFATILTEVNAAMRASAANAALAQGLAIAMMARGERRVRLQLASLGVGVLGAIALGWAGVMPDSANALLDRMSAVVAALLGSSALYGIGLSKVLPHQTEWTRAGRRLVPVLLVLGFVGLIGVLGMEGVARFSGRDLPMSWWAITAVSLSLLAASVAAIVAAVVPGRDPLGLSEKGRTAYVYGCEALLAALFFHVRLALPWLFSGFMARYAPLIILALGFVGVGLGEVFRRQKRTVLAEPLERTGAILPLLPLLGALWAPPRPGEDVVYLVLLGGLYSMLSLLRSSTGFGAIAAVAFNLALWAVLGRWEGHGVLEHPQLWLIPPALCVMAGVYLNRDRLSEAQAASIRNVAALAIYVSSTADVVLTGVGRAPWLPLVLGGLSLVGIFAGLFLRVRGFLFLGLGFLSLSVFAIIWYAAVDLRQTWIWAASGIAAGTLILALFAVFEKKRAEILGLIESLKGWDA